MRILLLGGTGDMGRRAAFDLAQAKDVERLTLGGRNAAKGEALAKQIGPKATAVQIDVQDSARLVRLMREHDVVASAVGPFYLYEVPLARAAIEARVPYVSICDDYDAADGVLQLDAEAKERGVTVLTGAGWTPGITNVLVRKGVDSLDQAEQAHVAWTASASDSAGYAVLFHMLHILTGMVPSYARGERINVPAGSGNKKVDFGSPIGAVTVYHVGHPEPVTLPRFIPDLQEVSLRGGLLEGYLNALGKLVTKLGLTRTHRSREVMVKLLNASLRPLKRLGAMKQPISGLHVEVVGLKGGRKASVTYTACGPMADLTALPLSITALMIGRGQVRQAGVLAPEAEDGIDPDLFLHELAARGVLPQGGEVRFLD